MIDVYLVPVGPDREELYCEVADALEESDDRPPTGIIGRMRARFREMLAEAERDRLQAHRATQTGWAGRVKARTMRWVAESIAEQRLLWHLRKETEGRLCYPDDMTDDAAAAELCGSLSRDFDKHRKWMIIDGILFVASGLLMLIPGPNLIAYYFAFRLVGHYFSLRGARQGLNGVRWCYEANPLLTELRRAITLEPEVRVNRVRDVASRLRLEHLPTFFERSAAIG